MVTAEQAAEAGIEYMQLDEIWKRADIVTVHTPLIPQTKGKVGTDDVFQCLAISKWLL